MTCVVALRYEDTVYMGADSAGTSTDWLLVPRYDPKIYRVGEFLFGFTTSYRMGQLLGRVFVPPEHPGALAIEDYMVQQFVTAVRRCLREGGFAKKENEVEKGGQFLVAYRSRIFNIGDDYSVGESQQPFDAVGTGYALALGALYALTSGPGMKQWSPTQLVGIALRAAEAFNAAVRSPFVFEQVPLEAQSL